MIYIPVSCCSQERITPRALSRISPRKYSLFGSPFQRLAAHRVGFASRSRVKLDFSSPKKGETATISPNTTTTSPATSVEATPINAEEKDTMNQLPGMNVIVKQVSNSEGSGSNQSISGNKQSQKVGVKNSNKKVKGNKRNRIVTFDEHQLNQSGSFSTIPIKDLLVLAQQQVSSVRSPKKNTPSLPSSPQPSPPQSLPQPRQRISNVTAVTIPDDTVSSVVTTVTSSSVVTTTTADMPSLQQQEVGGAGSINSSGSTSSSPCPGLPVTVAITTTTNTSTMVANDVTTSPALTTTCTSVTVANPTTTNTNPTRFVVSENIHFYLLTLAFNKTLRL